MGPIGMQEMIFIFILALVLFGPKKLPELGRLLGRGLTEFRRAKNELRTTFETHMRELEREANLDKQIQTPASSYKPDYSSPRYPYSYDGYGQDPTASEAIASAEKPDESEPRADSSLPDSAPPATEPVAGAVARKNGVQPVEHTAEEEHRPA
ncbi:MAG: twin-arginine translocase TatA/TatE family subunit [Acidobacteriaceae bacterium]|nr:twin-arginine translocase TatA/TatE family subunit [Acidobacteriaceae bacterium]MBV8573375.1 twin-arginine translocase TatA/TatE family subunit [Acidobacteriaceae bacterium]